LNYSDLHPEGFFGLFGVTPKDWPYWNGHFVLIQTLHSTISQGWAVYVIVMV
jgi:hypothetical protein